MNVESGIGIASLQGELFAKTNYFPILSHMQAEMYRKMLKEQSVKLDQKHAEMEYIKQAKGGGDNTAVNDATMREMHVRRWN